ncbi:MAG: hypothetical protein DU429_00825 [Candidatus Tokpelaia sp.]|nr:MAG: hypothetical protein DU430_06565 [Candidatus Tokpelaia sp.]KAA6207634.1 MAG: hypothetical protein DU429_00825 [Candidatus Tokpelaia sp.]
MGRSSCLLAAAVLCGIIKGDLSFSRCIIVIRYYCAFIIIAVKKTRGARAAAGCDIAPVPALSGLNIADNFAKFRKFRHKGQKQSFAGFSMISRLRPEKTAASVLMFFFDFRLLQFYP